MSVQVTLPEYTEFTAEEFKRIKSDYSRISGVYVLIGKNGHILYVGKSIDIKKRVEKHLVGHGNSERFYRKINKLRLYLCTNQFYVEIYETYLINELKPEFNRDKTFFQEFVIGMSDRLDELDLQIKDLNDERDSMLDVIRELRCEQLDEDESSFSDNTSAIRLAQISREISELRGERSRVRRRVRASTGAAANGR